MPKRLVKNFITLSIITACINFKIQSSELQGVKKVPDRFLNLM